jgi:hypothetical protein
MSWGKKAGTDFIIGTFFQIELPAIISQTVLAALYKVKHRNSNNKYAFPYQLKY